MGRNHRAFSPWKSTSSLVIQRMTSPSMQTHPHQQPASCLFAVSLEQDLVASSMFHGEGVLAARGPRTKSPARTSIFLDIMCSDR